MLESCLYIFLFESKPKIHEFYQSNSIDHYKKAIFNFYNILKGFCQNLRLKLGKYPI